MHAGKIHKGCNKIRAHSYFLVEVLLLLLLRAAAAHDISTEAERGTGYCFFLLRLRCCYCCFLCVYSIAVAVVEKGCMPEKTNKNITFSFLVAALLLLLTHREGCAEKKKIVFGFVFDTGTQSIAVCDSVRTAALSHSPRFLLPSSLPSCLYVCVLLSITTGTPSMEQWSHGAPRSTRNTEYYADLSFQNNLSCTGCTYVVLAVGVISQK